MNRDPWKRKLLNLQPETGAGGGDPRKLIANKATFAIARIDQVCEDAYVWHAPLVPLNGLSRELNEDAFTEVDKTQERLRALFTHSRRHRPSGVRAGLKRHMIGKLRDPSDPPVSIIGADVAQQRERSHGVLSFRTTS